MQQLVHLAPHEDSISFLFSFCHLFISTYIKLFHAVVISWTAGSNHFSGMPIFSVRFYSKINAFLLLVELYLCCIFLLLSRSQEAYYFFMTQGRSDYFSILLQKSFSFSNYPFFLVLGKVKTFHHVWWLFKWNPLNQPRVCTVDITGTSRKESWE